jgi:urea ABC transporter ATP-binding protein UrtE
MLSIQGLRAAYGSVPVLSGVDLTVSEGEILVLLGRNGVGKTTLMRTIAGLLRPTGGKVEFGNADITGLPPHRVARGGIAYVPQGRGIFPKLSVRENLAIGTRARGTGDDRIPDEIYRHFPILKERAEQLGGTLSGGQQQQLAIGRALCGNPKLLLLDEPSEGIQPNIVQDLGRLIRELVDRVGLSVLLVEQNLDLGLKVASRCVFMEKGAIVHEGKPDELRDEAILHRYLAI